MTTVTRYADGLITIDGHTCDYRVEQRDDGTHVWRVSRDPRVNSREAVRLPRNRYKLSNPMGAADFERDLLSVVS